jgi:hypothetical protein
MVAISAAQAQVGDWLVLRFANGNVAAGLARAVSPDIIGLKVWFDQWEQAVVSDEDLDDAREGIGKDYVIDSGCRVYRARREELTPLLSPVNDIDDIYAYLDGVAALGETEGQ